MGHLRLHIVTAILMFVLLFLQYRLWFESGGILDMIRLKKQLTQQTAANEVVKKQNETLLLQIERLQNSRDAVESRARNELGMVKKNETFYQFVK